MKNEWRTMPLRFVRRLDVEMVVDGHGRRVRSLDEASDDDGVPRSGEFFCSSTASADVRDRIVRELLDVSAMFANRADAGYFNPFLQFGFEVVLHRVIVP